METLVFVTWEIIMFMLNLTVCLVYTGYAFAIVSCKHTSATKMLDCVHKGDIQQEKQI